MSDAGPNPPAPDVDETLIKEIAAGVWVIPDRRVPLVPNIGIVVGDDRTLVVDVGMGPRNGARVLRAAQQKAGGRPLVVTTTHFHPEHGLGLQVFRDESHIVYNRSQLDEFREKAPRTSRCSRHSGRRLRRHWRASSSSNRTRPTTATGPARPRRAHGRASEPRARAHARRPGRLAARRADPLHGRPRRVADLSDLPFSRPTTQT